MASRPPLGVALMDSVGAQQPKPVSKGQMIAGILADALAGAMGRPGQFAQTMQQRNQQEQEDAQWTRRQQSMLQHQVALEDYKRTHLDPSPMERDAAAWQQMSPEQRTAYGQMKQAGAGDPDVYVSLPNGQFYAGPKSGLAAALSGGAAPAPTRPVGKLTPVMGGPTQPASGGFR